MNNTRKILLGLSLLGATSLLGFSAPASAAPKNKDIKDARKDVKRARKDVRRADTPEERRDAREDLRGEQRDLREERRENRPGTAYNRPNNDRSNYGRSNDNRSNDNRSNDNRSNYGRPGYDRPTYGRSTYGRSGSVGSSQSDSNTVQGTVTQDLNGNSFLVRSDNGQTVRVIATRGESYSISRGDTVRASGKYSGNSFNASNISILRNR